MSRDDDIRGEWSLPEEDKPPAENPQKLKCAKFIRRKGNRSSELRKLFGRARAGKARPVSLALGEKR